MNRAAGKNARKAGKMNAFGTLLSTAANMAMTGYQMGGTGGGKTPTKSEAPVQGPRRPDGTF